MKDGTRTHQHARVHEALSYFIEHVARVCPLSRGQAIGIPRVSTRRSDIVGWRDLERERRSIAFSRVTIPLEACCDNARRERTRHRIKEQERKNMKKSSNGASTFINAKESFPRSLLRPFVFGVAFSP